MKKTVKIDEKLHALVKAKAAYGGLSVEEYVADELKMSLGKTVLIRKKEKDAAKRRTKEKP